MSSKKTSKKVVKKVTEPVEEWVIINENNDYLSDYYFYQCTQANFSDIAEASIFKTESDALTTCGRLAWDCRVKVVKKSDCVENRFKVGTVINVISMGDYFIVNRDGELTTVDGDGDFGVYDIRDLIILIERDDAQVVYTPKS